MAAVTSDPLPRHLKRTGRQTEVELVDPPCPVHGRESFTRSRVRCREDHGEAPAGHNRWSYECGRRLYAVGGRYVERPACV